MTQESRTLITLNGVNSFLSDRLGQVCETSYNVAFRLFYNTMLFANSLSVDTNILNLIGDMFRQQSVINRSDL